MTWIRWATGFWFLAFYGTLAVAPTPEHQPQTSTKSTALIVPAGGGEEREFRTRPGTTFTLKVDPRNGGSKQLPVFAEVMAPGDTIPTHRHPHAEELILIHSGKGKVTLGEEVQEAQAGAVIFIPRDTWIGLENVGNEPLSLTAVFSEPGYEDYLRAVSVLKGQPVTPLTKSEVDALRRKFAHYTIYK